MRTARGEAPGMDGDQTKRCKPVKPGIQALKARHSTAQGEALGMD